MQTSGTGRAGRRALVLLLLTSLALSLLPAPEAPAAAAPVASAAWQADEPDRAGAVAPQPAAFARLETRRPTVQWSPAPSTEWQEVPDRQTVQAGDGSARTPRAPRA